MKYKHRLIHPMETLVHLLYQRRKVTKRKRKVSTENQNIDPKMMQLRYSMKLPWRRLNCISRLILIHGKRFHLKISTIGKRKRNTELPRKEQNLMEVQKQSITPITRGIVLTGGRSMTRRRRKPKRARKRRYS